MSKGNESLLLELSTMDSCEVRSATDAEHVAQTVPPWCEIIMTLERAGRTLPIHLRRHDGELIIECLHEAMHPWSGKSIVQRLWDYMDDVMDRLMEDLGDEDDRGFAMGIATALSLMLLPYSEDADIETIREQAIERWEERQ